MKSTVEWIPVDVRLPDEDMVVLAALSDGETWPAFLDGDQWRYVTADPIESCAVLWWCEMPAGPVSVEAA